MLKLTQINIYPVKSLDGFSPSSATVEPRGLQYDRRWMIVGEDGVFFSQRTQRKMTNLRARIDSQQLIIEEKNNLSNNIRVGLEEMTEEMQVSVWDDSVLAKKVSTLADDFLSHYLGTKCHLVKMPNEAKRRVEEEYNTGDDIVSFADGYPFLIIGEASINDLNTRLETPLNAENQSLVGMRRFRTNFVFSGGEPYEEETWGKFKIGKIAFQGMKPCGRCVMTTLDPDTGERSKEPLAKLAEYRKVGHKIPFGQNLIWKNSISEENTISIGDAIYR
jgi:uncharacterized protein